jgi:hypothetical protein
MATYRNKNDDTIFYGGEFKLKVSMDTIVYSGGSWVTLAIHVHWQ